MIFRFVVFIWNGKVFMLFFVKRWKSVIVKIKKIIFCFYNFLVIDFLFINYWIKNFFFIHTFILMYLCVFNMIINFIFDIELIQIVTECGDKVFLYVGLLILIRWKREVFLWFSKRNKTLLFRIPCKRIHWSLWMMSF